MTKAIPQKLPTTTNTCTTQYYSNIKLKNRKIHLSNQIIHIITFICIYFCIVGFIHNCLIFFNTIINWCYEIKAKHSKSFSVFIVKYALSFRLCTKNYHRNNRWQCWRTSYRSKCDSIRNHQWYNHRFWWKIYTERRKSFRHFSMLLYSIYHRRN